MCFFWFALSSPTLAPFCDLIGTLWHASMLQCGKFNFKSKITFLLKLPLEILGKISPRFGCKCGSESNLVFDISGNPKSQYVIFKGSCRPILCTVYKKTRFTPGIILCQKTVTTREPQNNYKWFKVKKGVWCSQSASSLGRGAVKASTEK